MSSKFAEDKYDLEKAWDDVCTSFAKATDKNLRDHPRYTPEEVLDQIRAKQDKDEEKNAKFKAAKDALTKTLDCINNLGGIVAQGSSMVSV
jgi:fungal STAND N-terminal Goodbye domain